MVELETIQSITATINNEKVRQALLNADIKATEGYISNGDLNFQAPFHFKQCRIWHVLAAGKEEKHIQFFTYMLKRYEEIYGAKVSEALLNSVDVNGLTPLHQAALVGNIIIIRRLIEMGADTSLVDRDGYDYIAMLKEKKYGHLIPEIERFIHQQKNNNIDNSPSEQVVAAYTEKCAYSPKTSNSNFLTSKHNVFSNFGVRLKSCCYRYFKDNKSNSVEAAEKKSLLSSPVPTVANSQHKKTL